MNDPKGKSAFEGSQVGLRRMLAPLLRFKSERPDDPGDGSASDNGSLSSDQDPDIRLSVDGDVGHGAGGFSGKTIYTIIESDIVPRLLMAHSSDTRSDRKGPFILNGSTIDEPCIEAAMVATFAELPLTMEAAELAGIVDQLLDSGIPVEAVCVDLLAPTARHLGEMWERDECDFVDVTMGLWRLQEVMREIGSRHPSMPQKAGPNGRMSAIFSPIPGDDHSFGALMIDQVFTRGGWASEAIPQPERRELLNAVSRRPFDLIGLTITRDCPVAVLRKLIKALRKVSANPQVAIIVGGRFVESDPSIVAEIGADGTGADARAALSVAERLVASTPEYQRG